MPQANYQTARAYDRIFSVQFSVFLSNRVGQLKEMLDLFAREAVRVLGISIVDSTDWAVIRVLFDDPTKARQILRNRSLPFTESEVLLAELTGPDSLASICAHLLSAEINVHFAYPLMIRRGENPVMVFHVDDHVLAVQALSRHGFTLLTDQDLADLQ